MKHCDAFDYWGQGTEVTVTSETSASPKVFPLVPCISAAKNKTTLGCLAYDFFPKTATFEWTDAGGSKQVSHDYISTPSNNSKYTGVSVIQISATDSSAYKCSVNHPGGNKLVEVKLVFPPKVTLLSVPSGDQQALVCSIEKYLPETLSVNWKKNGRLETGFTNGEPQKTGDVYSTISVLKVTKADWDSTAVYTCEVTHSGATYTKKASKALITVTLNPPSPKVMFSNNQVALECVITGQDRNTVSKTEITWQINGQHVTGDVIQSSDQKKTSKLTHTLTDWAGVNKVRCSAVTEDMTPVIKELTVRKGDGTEPKVTVHILPEEDIGQEVTLVCLVSSSKLQDYYIAWSEDNGRNTGLYTDGVNFPPQKTNNGYSVTSLYTTTKEKWNKDYKFKCNVWSAGRDGPMKPRAVSKAMDALSESNLQFALNCTDEDTDEDELSSLWFTSSCFIFLFILSVFYNMIFSLVKMKNQ